MEEEKVVSKGFASDMGDVPGSLVVLAIALFFLCFALYWIVRILHYLVLASGRRTDENGEPTPFIRITQKVLGMNPVLSIIYGMLMTIAVQSSSITTSTLTPLVALDIITLEQMLPLTLGANIGTTCTAFIASVVSGSQDAIQVSHFQALFNRRLQAENDQSCCVICGGSLRQSALSDSANPNVCGLAERTSVPESS